MTQLAWLVLLLTFCFCRCTLFNLQGDRLSEGYRARLLTAGNALVQFCHNRGVSPAEVLSSPGLANRALVDFVQYLHDTRKPLWLATHAVLSVQTANRFMRGLLRPAWDSISSWKLSIPVKSRTPMDCSIMKAVFYFAICQAMMFDISRRQIWLSFALCIRLGFFALLRPKEWFNLRRSHMKIPLGTLLSGRLVAVLTILDPKNRAFMGRLQVRLVKDRGTVLWLKWFAESMAPNDLVWPYCRQTFMRCFKDAIGFFQLEHLNLSPASMRAGGATFMLEQGYDPSSIKFAGSWASDKALACYLQEAEAASTLLSLSLSEQRRLEHVLQTLCFLEEPPCPSVCAQIYGSSSCARNPFHGRAIHNSVAGSSGGTARAIELE